MMQMWDGVTRLTVPGVAPSVKIALCKHDCRPCDRHDWLPSRRNDTAFSIRHAATSFSTIPLDMGTKHTTASSSEPAMVPVGTYIPLWTTDNECSLLAGSPYSYIHSSGLSRRGIPYHHVWSIVSGLGRLGLIPAFRGYGQLVDALGLPVY